MPHNRPNHLDAGQRAALRRLRRAQLAEARRIRQVVAGAYGLAPAHLCAPCRRRSVAEPRQVAMFLMVADLRWPTSTRTVPFPAARIGRLLGGRDHSTVMHDIAVIAARLTGTDEDNALRVMVADLRAALDGAYEGAGPRRAA